MSGAELLSIYGLVAVVAALAAVLLHPMLARWWTYAVDCLERYQQAKVTTATKELDDLFMEVQPTWLRIMYGLGPFAAGILLYLIFDNVLLAGVGVVAGFILPDLWVKQRRAMRKRQFRAQLVDALFILSSSLRAGLSLTQAFETLESEMSPPASQEFGLMIKAQRLGQPFEETLQGLNARMACEELDLITTAVLVARETGGDLTSIIAQLITTIREKRKLLDKVATLTLQGRLQAYIMSALPLVFAAFVRTTSPHYFDVFFQDTGGLMVLGLAAGLWLVGMVLLAQLSKVRM